MNRLRALQRLLPAAEANGAFLPLMTGGQRRDMGQLVLRNDGLRAGDGGRQSISGVTATVFGANGFLGRYIVSRIGQNGGRVICPHRCDELELQHLWPMGDLGAIYCLENFSIRDDEFIRKSVAKSNVVINLINSDRDTWNFDLEEVNADFPRRLAEICAQTPSVERLIQLSCLGASEASPSKRLATKARGDAAVMAAFPAATLIRAGPLVGVEDRFLNDMALWRFSGSGVPLIDGGDQKVQPAYVVDVAEAAVKTLEYKAAAGATYELGAEGVYTLTEVAKIVCMETREDFKSLILPGFIAGAIAGARAYASKFMPMVMFTRDIIFTPSYVAEADTDKVVSPGALTFKDLHVIPRKMTDSIAIDHVRYWRKGGYDYGTKMDEGSISADRMAA